MKKLYKSYTTVTMQVLSLISRMTSRCVLIDVAFTFRAEAVDPTIAFRLGGEIEVISRAVLCDHHRFTWKM